MCQRKEDVAVGRIEFGPEQRAEIDYRVAQKLAEREYFNRQYTRGVWDALYYIFIVAMLAYAVYLNFWKDGE